MLREHNNPSVEKSRYIKFSWNNNAAIPDIGKIDYEPKNGAFRIYKEGTFTGCGTYGIQTIKKKQKLLRQTHCIYCGRNTNEQGENLKLTDEHIIPEFLGASLLLPNSTCPECQNVTAEFESSVATQTFDPIRKAFGIRGKGGQPDTTMYPVDLGRETTDIFMINIANHPTILTLPNLFPASIYSDRPANSNGLFNITLFNINADKEKLEKYEIDGFSSQIIDLARFCQMIAKIGLSYACGVIGINSFNSIVSDFVRTRIIPKKACNITYNFVGGLWRYEKKQTKYLHELELSRIEWGEKIYIAVRVRLFASYGMPSYFVAVGEPL